MKRALLLRLVLGLILVSFLPSCGFEFRKAWKQAEAIYPTKHSPSAYICTPPSPIEGRWEGAWLSEASGHHGTLRCVITTAWSTKGALPDTKNISIPPYLFFYQATWKTILSGSYKAMHAVKQQKDGTFIFEGEHKMPNWAGGLYHYEGAIKGDEFKANYRCSMDNGTYTMKRVR